MGATQADDKTVAKMGHSMRRYIATLLSKDYFLREFLRMMRTVRAKVLISSQNDSFSTSC